MAVSDDGGDVTAEGRTTNRRWRRGIVPLALLACLLLVEGAPRVCPTCASWAEPGDRLGRILRLFERHPTRIWTLRRGLRTEHEGAAIAINDLALRGPAPAADTTATRILCLGESLCFGWGVAMEQAYPHQLQRLLTDRKGRSVEVINAGTPGYTTHQGLIQLREMGFDLQPDLVVVPFVVNDVDRLRFFANDGSTDAELSPGSGAACALRNLLGRSYTFVLYQRALLWTARRVGGPRAEAHALASTLRCRVPAGDYESNLRAFVATCRERGVPLLFVVQPLHLPVPEVDASSAELQPLLDTLAAGRGDLATGDARAVAEHARDRIEQVLDLADYATDDEVRAAIELSRTWDAYRCRAQAIRYNAIMRRVARDSGTPVADVSEAVRIRRAACDDGIAVCGEPLYRDAHGDPIHPTADGHLVYAHVITRAIDEMW